MAAPSNQQVLQWVVPPGQAQVQYSPQALAWTILNYEVTNDGTIRTVRNPSPYEIIKSGYSTVSGGHHHRVGDPMPLGSLFPIDSTITCPINGVFHAKLFSGVADMLIVSAGNQLFMHMGWSDFSGPFSSAVAKFVGIESGLTTPTPAADTTVAGPLRYPDQFLVMNDLIIFTNGQDQARIIAPDGRVFPMGFSDPPSAPAAEGPAGLDIEGRDHFYPNSHGYSWEGKIGTAGDMLDSDGGGVMAGHWIYHVQYEDQFGNFSATSPPSNAVSIEPSTASPLRGAIDGYTGGGDEPSKGIASTISALERTLGVEIKDVQRQFLVRCSLPTGNHDVVSVRLYRTPDIDNVGPEPRFLDRVSIGRDFAYPDNLSDAELGDGMTRTVPVPIFKVMCTHQGRLVIGNVTGEPGKIMRSIEGFPGTFTETDFVYPDSGGSEVTGVVSHNGVLLAFTSRSVYSLADFSQPMPMSQGLGCVAPNSIKAMRDGTLIWLGRDGFYAMRGGEIQLISAPIDRIIQKKLNRSRMRMAQAVIDPASGEYRCALAPAGTSAQRLVLAFDGAFWRELDYGMHIAGWARTDDWRDLTMFLGADASLVDEQLGGLADDLQAGRTDTLAEAWYKRGPSVYVTNRETFAGTQSCEMSHRSIYRSGWLRADQNALTPTNVRTIYLGLVDTENAQFKIKLYKNGSAQPESIQTVTAAGLDDATGIVAEAGGSAVLGQARAQLPRLFWRQVPVNLNNVNTWSFEIESTVDLNGGLVEIAAFAFDVSAATGGNIRARIPQREDE